MVYSLKTTMIFLCIFLINTQSVSASYGDTTVDFQDVQEEHVVMPSLEERLKTVNITDKSLAAYRDLVDMSRSGRPLNKSDFKKYLRERGVDPLALLKSALHVEKGITLSQLREIEANGGIQVAQNQFNYGAGDALVTIGIVVAIYGCIFLSC